MAMTATTSASTGRPLTDAVPATLNVTLMGSGSGTVSGGGLTCTGALGQTCSGTFQVGDVITLSASAGTGEFAGGAPRAAARGRAP